MKKRFKERLQDQEAVHGCWLNMGSSVSSEIVGSAGFDWVLIDLEHGAGNEPQLLGQLQSLKGSGTFPVVRTESYEAARVKRVLDLGASGIMFPQIQNLEEAKLAISNMYYPPVGRRGLAKMIRATQYGAAFDQYHQEIKENLLGVIQIETLESLKYLDEIAALDGVDVLFLGPADLSMAMGIFGEWEHPDFVSAVAAIGKAAKKAGKAAGVLFFDLKQYDFYYQQGFRFLASGSDMVFVNQGARKLVDDLNEQKIKNQ